MSSGYRVILTVSLLGLAVVVGMSLFYGTTTGPAAGNEFQFKNVTERTGFTYHATTTSVDRGNGNSGVYTTDFNNDGWTDLLAVGGDEPALFENVRGEFRRSTALPSVDGAMRAALFFDYNDDGWEDLLLLRDHDRPVFLQNEGGDFTIKQLGFDRSLEVPVGATAADYNGDGRLDVFVIQYGDWSEEMPDGYMNDPEFIPEDNGNPNYLFENTGDGFERVDDNAIGGERWSLATSFVDLTGDRRPDIHVANDFNNDIIYVNRGDGEFEQTVLGNATARNAMSSEIADVNGDGRQDIFVTNIYIPTDPTNLTEFQYWRLKKYFSFMLRGKRIMGNNLLINQGDGTFIDRAGRYNVTKGGWGWAAAFEDFDNDGDEDLIHSTQLVLRINSENPRYTYPTVWERRPEEFVLKDASDVGFEEASGRGLATLDFDHDGDMDVVMSVYDGKFVLYENTIDARNSVELRVLTERNETALGSTVILTVNGETQRERLNVRADYQSQDARVLHFGVENAKTIDTIRIIRPDGTEQVLKSVRVNQQLAIRPDGIVRTNLKNETGVG